MGDHLEVIAPAGTDATDQQAEALELAQRIADSITPEPLGAEFEAVLFEHLWDLYES